MERLCRGTSIWRRLAERRWRRDASEVGVQQSVRYEGALPWRQLYTIVTSLYFTHSGTSSQWSPPPSSCTDAHFWVKIGCFIKGYLTWLDFLISIPGQNFKHFGSWPPVLLGQFQHWWNRCPSPANNALQYRMRDVTKVCTSDKGCSRLMTSEHVELSCRVKLC